VLLAQALRRNAVVSEIDQRSLFVSLETHRDPLDRRSLRRDGPGVDQETRALDRLESADDGDDAAIGEFVLDALEHFLFVLNR